MPGSWGSSWARAWINAWGTVAGIVSGGFTRRDFKADGDAKKRKRAMDIVMWAAGSGLIR